MGMTTTILGNYLLLMQVKTIQKHILYHQFHRLSGATLDMTVEERVKLAESLMLRFRHASTQGRFVLLLLSCMSPPYYSFNSLYV